MSSSLVDQISSIIKNSNKRHLQVVQALRSTMKQLGSFQINLLDLVTKVSNMEAQIEETEKRLSQAHQRITILEQGLVTKSERIDGIPLPKKSSFQENSFEQTESYHFDDLGIEKTVATSLGRR